MSDDPADDRKDAAAPSPSGDDLVAAARTRRRNKARATPPPRTVGEAPPARRRETEPTGEMPPPPPTHAWEPAVTGLGRWGIAGLAACAVLMTLTLVAAGTQPDAPPVVAVRARFADGPMVPDAEFQRWVRSFPEFQQLDQPNAWLLDKLTLHLARNPAVERVERIAAVQRVRTAGPRSRLVRELEVGLTLRTPFLPAVTAAGARVWIDREGRVLPGILPAPRTRGPLVTGIEGGGARLATASAIWMRMAEAQLRPGLVREIRCDEQLDHLGNRGIVLVTAQGVRIDWGRPEEAKYGLTADQRTDQAIHTLRCQGDLGRIAAINVRFGQPWYTLRSQP